MTLTVQQMLAAAEAVVPRISADEAKGLVGRADAKPGWQGVMLDDLWAGLFAGIATLAAAGLAHGVLM
jgi:phosphatidylglycerophosphatase A